MADGFSGLRVAADVTGLVGTADARDLSFIDHRGLIRLVGHIRGRGATTTLIVRRHSVVSVLAGLLELPDLRVVAG